jgi:hypothetical protein
MLLKFHNIDILIIICHFHILSHKTLYCYLILTDVYVIAEVCVYKGTMYTQGQKWQDGCQFECVCDDAMSGHYHCTDRWHNSSLTSFICLFKLSLNCLPQKWAQKNIFFIPLSRNMCQFIQVSKQSSNFV